MRTKILCFCYVHVLCTAIASAQTTNPITTGAIQARLRLVTTVTSSAGGAPNFGVHHGDPRFLYVGEQNGNIRILDFNQANPLSGTNFLNIDTVLGTVPASTNRVLLDDTGTGERGLLGAAFHPDFSVAGSAGFRKFYTYTSERLDSGSPITFTHPELGSGGNHQSVIREWTAGAPNAGGVTTINTSIAPRVLFRMARPQGNHNGGGMAFGQDKNLYITSGDGGGSNDFSNNNVASTTDGHTNSPGGNVAHGNGQDITNVYGKIIRIKPTTDVDAGSTLSPNGQYRIPTSNPFAGATPGVDEIFAYGLRNPFRMSFDRSGNGKGYIADVGQGAAEEVNLLVNGGNYGWVIKEGFADTPGQPNYNEPAGLVNPLAAYAGSQGDAVIGGFVYRGPGLPQLQGKYVFGDFRFSGSGRLLYMDVNEASPNTVFQFGIDPAGFAKPSALLHGVAESATGQIYYLFGNGQIVELVPEPATWALAALGGIALALHNKRRKRAAVQ